MEPPRIQIYLEGKSKHTVSCPDFAGHLGIVWKSSDLLQCCDDSNECGVHLLA